LKSETIFEKSETIFERRRSVKKLLAEILAGVVLCGIGFAETPAPGQSNGAAPPDPTRPAATEPVPSGSEPTDGAPRLAPGSVISVRLTKTIDAKKAKSGDEVDVRVTEDMKTVSGQVLVPKDTMVVGHITETQTRSKQQQASKVGIAFDRAVLKNGGDLSVPMSIQAVIAPPALTPDNSNNAGGSPPQPTALPSGGGVSAGNTSDRSPGMGAGTPSGTPNSPAAGGQWPTATPTGTSANPSITASTQGVVGISNLKLSATANSTRGSVVSSEKSNVKLENGTFMLLRVN
jgi:hypothetical protein